MEKGERIALRRDVRVVEIPQGTEATLPEGASVTVVQTLGGNVTVSGGPPHSAPGQLYRVEAEDLDALGVEPKPGRTRAGRALPLAPVDEDRVWQELRTIFDPEIPVNLVELGLIYRMDLAAGAEGKRIEVDMTLTAPGCGMADVLKRDVEKKLAAIPGVEDVQVEVVFDPPWTRDRMSEAAKLTLGMF